MPAGGIIVLASGALLAAAWLVSRFIAGVFTYAETQCALPDAYGDVVELPREAAASKPYLAGEGRTEQTRRRGTQHNRTIMAVDRTHSERAITR